MLITVIDVLELLAAGLSPEKLIQEKPDQEGYDITAARGFIDLFGLPMKVRGMKQKPKV